MKQYFEKIKEKWFWFTHPNLCYQVEEEEEQDMWRKYLMNKEEWSKDFSQEERDQLLKILNGEE